MDQELNTLKKIATAMRALTAACDELYMEIAEKHGSMGGKKGYPPANPTIKDWPKDFKGGV